MVPSRLVRVDACKVGRNGCVAGEDSLNMQDRIAKLGGRREITDHLLHNFNLACAACSCTV